MDQWKPAEAVRASRSTERTPRHRMLPTRTPHRGGLAMRARIRQQPRSRRQRAMPERGPESQSMYVLRTARDLLDQQELDHEGRLRRAYARELYRPLDRRWRTV